MLTNGYVSMFLCSNCQHHFVFVNCMSLYCNSYARAQVQGYLFGRVVFYDLVSFSY